MFISDLFEAKTKQTLVLIPGGFHPFHPGHLSLYRSAESAFPGATIVYVATDDRKDRPFPFVEKQKLAQIAGVNPQNFQLVKSPFVAKEVTQNFDPNTTVLIFARSEKDRNEHPKPGGVKKDGSPSYLQPYQQGNLAPMSQHGYMAYLPVVEFDAGPSGVTSATQIRDMWPQANDAQKNEIVTDLYPKNPREAKQILDKYLGQGVAEGSKYKCSCHPGDPDPDCPVHGLEPMEVGDALDVKKGVGESTAQDPNVIQMKKRARVAHPFAASDEEALALYISDREIKDVDNLEAEQNRELRMINRIEQGEEKLAHQLQSIDRELAQLQSMARGK